jgi:hypothetical protein
MDPQVQVLVTLDLVPSWASWSLAAGRRCLSLVDTGRTQKVQEGGCEGRDPREPTAPTVIIDPQNPLVELIFSCSSLPGLFLHLYLHLVLLRFKVIRFFDLNSILVFSSVLKSFSPAFSDIELSALYSQNFR